MKLLAMHRKTELACESDGLDGDGRGLLALASRDGGSIFVQAVNYAKEPASAQIVVDNLPAGKIRVRQYRINSRHANCLADSSAKGDVVGKPCEVAEQDGRLVFNIDFEPHDIWAALVDVG